MRKKILLIVLLLGLITLPLKSVSAEGEKYQALDLEETLADDGIEVAFKDYNPSEDAITIYLFRGNGCGYCHAFLEFLNSITDEYGKYFKLESYEVWYNQNNAELMQEVSTFMGSQASGVPYIIIGDKVIGGYSENYNDQIKNAIMELYKTKKNKRYDVMKKMKGGFFNLNIKDNLGTILPLLYALVSTGIIITYINLKFKELYANLDLLNKKKVGSKK